VLSAVAIIPSAPVLVPELAGTATAELTDLHAAVSTAVAVLPPRWIAVGAAGAEVVIPADAVGTFAGYGVDITVTGTADATHVVDMPLCALIAAWTRGRYRPDASVETHCYAGESDDPVADGRALRTQIDESGIQTGVLIIADGYPTLTPSAPGGYLPETLPRQDALDDALAGGDTGVLGRLDDGVVGRVAFGVLAGLAGAGPHDARQYYRGAPYGVGYFVGVWRP